MSHSVISLGLGLGGGKASTSSGRLPGGSFVNEYSLNFDGSNEYMAVAASSDFEFGTGDFSTSLWFKADTIGAGGADYYALYDFRGGGSDIALTFYLSTHTGYRLYAYNGSTVVNYNTTPSVGQWYHLAYTRSGTTGTIYLNGSSVASGTDSGNYNMSTPAPKICGPAPGVTGQYFDGKIDELAVFDSALSAPDISTLRGGVSAGTLGEPADISSLDPIGWWRMGDGGTWGGTNWTIPDASTNSNAGTTDNMVEVDRVTAVPPGYSTKALDINGSNEYVDCGGASTFSFTDGAGNDDAFSISAWVKFDSLASQRIVTKGATEFLFGLDSSNQFSLLLWSGGALSAYIGQKCTDTLSTGTWYHLAATYTGSNADSGIKLYINGADSTDATYSTGSYAGMTASSDSLLIGKWSYGAGSHIDGLADEVAIFDSALSAPNITAIYNSGVPAKLSSPPPVGWWRMGEDATWDGSNWTIPDASTEATGNVGTTQNMAEADRVTDTP